jgi:hypothetical protein
VSYDSEAKKNMRLGSGTEYLLRYGYGGLLFALLAVLIAPGVTGDLIEGLGVALAPLAAVACGAGLYVLERYVLSEWTLFMFVQYYAHRLVDCLWGHTKLDKVTDAEHYIRLLISSQPDTRKCSRRRARLAYVAACRYFFDEKTKKRYGIAHGEMHVLWLTAWELLGFSLYIYLGADPRHALALALLIGACAVFAVGVMADMQVHREECHILRTQQADLTTFLRSSGYMSPAK